MSTSSRHGVGILSGAPAGVAGASNTRRTPMFLALRELAFARGRFSLMGVVIALIAILMVLLSGLSAGLVNDGVSGLKALPPSTAFAFDAGTKQDNAFSRSVVDETQLAAWRSQPDVAG